MITRIQVFAVMKLALVCVMALVLTQAATAEVVIFDNFDRADGKFSGTATSDGNGTWHTSDNAVSYQIVGNAAEAMNNNNSNRGAYMSWSAPSDKTYSVSATVTRSLNGTSNHSHGIGFVDGSVLDDGCGSTGCAHGLTMAIDIGGNAYFWANGFGKLIKHGGMLSDVGLANDSTDPIELTVEVDPVANIGRGLINGQEILNIPWDASADAVTGAGIYNSSTGGASWDNFTISVVPEPTSLVLLVLGGLLLAVRRK